jgi:hypothetical protein
MPLRCKGKLMSELHRWRSSLSLIPAVMTGLASSIVLATDFAEGKSK